MNIPGDDGYREMKKLALQACPRDAEPLGRWERDVARCATFRELIDGGEQIVRRLVFWRSRRAALRLRDLRAPEVVREQLERAKKLADVKAIRRELLAFPFSTAMCGGLAGWLSTPGWKGARWR